MVDDERGAPEGWVPAFPGQRPPFAKGNELAFVPGNQAAVTHGVYSKSRLIPLVEKIYAELRASIGQWSNAYETSVRGLAELRARKNLAVQWLDENELTDEKGEVRPLLRELVKWEGRELDLARELALTVRSRAQLELDQLAATKDRISLAEVQPMVTEFARIAVNQTPPEKRAETFRMLKEAAAGLVSVEDGVVVDEDS